MGDVIVFTPKAARSAEENLAAFVRFAAENLTRFGANLEFSSDVWDVTDHVANKGDRQARSNAITLLFSHRGPDRSRQPMSDQIKDFAKAYLRYRGDGSGSSLRAMVSALRTLDVAMTELDIPNVTRCNGAVFDRALATVASFGADKQEAVRYALEAVAAFLDEHGLASNPIGQWRGAVQRSNSRSRTGNRSGVDVRPEKSEKLPRQEVLDAIPRAYRLASDPRDVIITSIAALLCAAPERINEVLVIAADCEVEQDGADGRTMLGLRWKGSKGAADHVKWILPGMADVVREALGRIRAETAGARDAARWYEAHPDRLYLPPALQHLRSRPFLTQEEVSAVMALGPNRKNVLRWIDNAGLPAHYEMSDRGGRARVVAFDDLEKHVLSLLPRGFPFFDARTGLRCSEALLLVPYGLFTKKGANKAVGSPCLFEAVDYHHVSVGLGGNAQAGSVSVFQRCGLDPERRLSVTSHQFRHYLNTLAQAGGLSQVDIAKWSGRANIHQNADYDHSSPEEIIARLRSVVGDQRMAVGPISEAPSNLPVTREEFAAMAVPTAHATEYGFCVHDFSASPCEMFRKCLDCREHFCVKGDPAKAQRVRRSLDIAQTSLGRARAAVMDEVYGAEDWVETHERTVARLGQLVAILEDDEVPDGTVIHLSGAETLTIAEGAFRDREILEEHAAVALADRREMMEHGHE